VHPYLTASPDAICDDEKGNRLIIEIKRSTAAKPHKRWKDQVQHQLFVCQIHCARLVVYNPETTQMEVTVIEANSKWQVNALRAYTNFYDTHLSWFWK
jgi:hypothetical protein